MEVSWINVADTAVKIGFGAIIAAVSGYVALIKNQKYEVQKFNREHFHKFQEEKKLKYVELLVQSQHLMQSHLFTSSAPDSEEIKNYLRIFNEVQILSDDAIRLAAFEVYSSVEAFTYLRKEEQEIAIIDSMRDRAREKISIFQKVAQIEVTKLYTET